MATLLMMSAVAMVFVFLFGELWILKIRFNRWERFQTLCPKICRNPCMQLLQKLSHPEALYPKGLGCRSSRALEP